MVSAVHSDTPPRGEHTPWYSEPVTPSSPSHDHQISLQVSSHFAQDSHQQNKTSFKITAASTIQHTGLSPRRVHSLPRAWERRPATPHVPRNEAQKIWKRVALSVVGTGEAQQWRKETSKLKTRPVKRLRVTHLGDDEDKENVDYAASKWEEEGLATPSPKRKVVECGVRTVAELQNTHVLAEDDDEEDELDEIQHSFSSPELGIPTARASIEEPHPSENEEADPTTDQDPPNLHLEPEGLETSPTAISHDSAIPSPDTAMASPTRRSRKLLSQDDDCCAERPQDALAAVSARMTPVEGITPNEDTAFLYAFLSRTRARKETKEEAEPEVIVPSKTEEDSDEAADELMDARTPNSSKETPEPEQAPSDLFQATEASITLSPRRSSRFATRLPRIQRPASNPPATISLKRLNGTELVANSRENPSIAVATRQNTRCNRFGGMPVKTRLIQLAAEAEAREASASSIDACQILDQDTDAAEKGKMLKGICWAEILATYQDGSEPLKNSSVVDGALILAEVSQKGDHSTEASVDADTESDPMQETLANHSIQDLVQLLQDKKAVASTRGGVRKVRRLRRLNTGTVNGTPAPKMFTGTQLPVPVGWKNSTMASSSSGAKNEKAPTIDATLSEHDSSKVAQAKDGVQTRTRSRSTRNG